MGFFLVSLSLSENVGCTLRAVRRRKLHCHSADSAHQQLERGVMGRTRNTGTQSRSTSAPASVGQSSAARSQRCRTPIDPGRFCRHLSRPLTERLLRRWHDLGRWDSSWLRRVLLRDDCLRTQRFERLLVRMNSLYRIVVFIRIAILSCSGHLVQRRGAQQLPRTQVQVLRWQRAVG